MNPRRPSARSNAERRAGVKRRPCADPKVGTQSGTPPFHGIANARARGIGSKEYYASPKDRDHSHRWDCPYDREMSDSLLNQMKEYVGLTRDDERVIAGLAHHLQPHIPGIVDRFYEVLMQHPEARKVFSEGETQIARQRAHLANWMRELFSGAYETSYFQNRYTIGSTHVRVGLPQRFMLLGMEIIWQEIVGVLKGTANRALMEQLESLHKLLILDLTIMLQSYQESFSNRVRAAERSAMEAKLIRAEHLAEIGQLAASLAHEIKNPLAGISGAIQVIGDAMNKNDPHRGIVTEILEQIGRLDATVKDLLLYARPPMPSPRAVKFAPLVSRVLTLLREEPAVRRVRVAFDDTDAETVLYADEGQLQQLLINLILNAAHASRNGSMIRIGTHQEGTFTCLTVRDGGHGMKPEVLAQALEPFFTTKARGTGLGLAICRRIAESHGGTIQMESKVGEGTTVSVRLPVREQPGLEGN